MSNMDMAKAMAMRPPLPLNEAGEIRSVVSTVPADLPKPKASMSLFEGINHFEKMLDGKVASNQMESRAAKERKHHIKSVKWRLKDVPLADCDDAYLMKIRAIFTARPLRRPRVKKVNGKLVPMNEKPRPVKVQTVENWLSTLGMIFEHLRRTPSGQIVKNPFGSDIRLKLWTPETEYWRAAFTMTKKERKNLMTLEERHEKEDGEETYTLDEIAKLWHVALPYERLMLLSGLFLGWTQIEISTFRTPHILDRNGEMFIRRERHKTNEIGDWWVCPELAALIRKFQTKENPNKWVFLTRNNLQLVREDESDAVSQTWERLTRRAKRSVAYYSFKYLRKLGGRLIEGESGSEAMAQIFFAQGSYSVARQNYLSKGKDTGIGQTPFQRLHEVQRAIYTKYLVPIFNGKGKQVKKSETVAA
jgi:hypothetical protein